MCPSLSRRSAMLAAAGWLVAGAPRAAAPASPAEVAALYRAQVDARLDVPRAEVERYARAAELALDRAGRQPAAGQYLLLVDRDPWVQAALLLWRSAEGAWELAGASPVSTGLPGSFDHFETPLGVFEHLPANPDFRAEGTVNENGIRGYGAKGMRVFDFGWQRVPKGWGDGKAIEMRLQMHATDPDLLERRLGHAQSKGCIRIPAALNRFLDHYGLLDARYEEAARSGHAQWVLPADREPAAGAGSLLVVVDSGRSDRAPWSPAPYIPHRRPAPPQGPRAGS